MCGGHHVAAGGGSLHELGARILRLEAGDVRGDVVNLLVRLRVMVKQDLSRRGWETVFPADCGDAYFVRKASGTRIALVRLTASCHTPKESEVMSRIEAEA